MNREPSIHITKTRLRHILNDYDTSGILGINTADLANYILSAAKKHALTNRSLLAKGKKEEVKGQKLLSSGIGDAQLFAKTLTLLRRQAGHRGIGIIKESSKDWAMIKECTFLAIDCFCNGFGLDKEEAFKAYISIALLKMKKFSLAKFNSMQVAIADTYQAMDRIKNDHHSDRTEKAMLFYNSIIAEKTGTDFDYKRMPEKYHYFIDVVDTADKMGIKVKDYLRAQFFAFDWRNDIPDVLQLIGDKAEERVRKYMIKEGIRAEVRTKAIDFSQIKKHGKDRNN